MAGFHEKEYNNPFSLAMWKKLIPFLKPYRNKIILVIALMMSAAGIDIILPLFQRFAIDYFIERETIDTLWWFFGLNLVVISVQTIIVIIFVKNSMDIEMSLGKDMKMAQFLHLQSLSFSYYNTTPVGYIFSRVMSDTLRIAALVAWSLIDLCWAAVYVIGAFIAMFILNYQLALIVAIILPVISLATYFFQKAILKYNRKVRKINSEITSGYNEGILGTKTSKALVMEARNLSDFKGTTTRMYEATMRTVILNAVFVPLVGLFSSFAIAMVLYQGGILSIDGAIQVGTLSAFIAYGTGIFEPIQQIARLIAEIISAQANIERVTGLLETKTEIIERPEVIEKYGDNFTGKKENWEELGGEIEFVDVSFKYPDGHEYILEHFNLKIEKGTTVAIVGETGAGKSTLVNLACRFFEPTEGQILIDGRDYRERSQLWLHSNLGYVLQTPHLFSGTIADNIRYGKLDATQEEIEEAAKKVCADTVVAKMKDGYKSDVGEGGDMLSTGEKQLISFARAIITDPKIFVLDEATSSIDTHTERLIQTATEYLLKDRTSFVIAHRLSTIKNADLILVVSDGKIVEQGSHTELLKVKGEYYTLYNHQFEEEAQALLLK